MSIETIAVSALLDLKSSVKYDSVFEVVFRNILNFVRQSFWYENVDHVAIAREIQHTLYVNANFDVFAYADTKTLKFRIYCMISNIKSRINA